jgi:nitrite reductase (NO-forming)
MRNVPIGLYVVMALMVSLMAACTSPATQAEGETQAVAAASPQPTAQTPMAMPPDVTYTLKTDSSNGLAFVGVGGDIEGIPNPTLTADPGDVVQITLINADGIMHDLVIDEFGVSTGQITNINDQVTVTFTAVEAGQYVYYCAIPGHRQAGMWGTLQVGEVAQQPATGANIVRSPTDLPAPIGGRGPERVRVDLVAQEVEGQLADGTTLTYFTFNGAVPGPMIRVRVGDTTRRAGRPAAEYP